MTVQEAIELLDNLVGMIEDNQNNDYDKALKMGIEAMIGQCVCEQIKWERDIALSQLEEIGLGLGEKTDRVREALRKQTAKKIIKEKGECYEMTKDGTKRYEITFICPSCLGVQEGDTYCWKCGQKLDWGD